MNYLLRLGLVCGQCPPYASALTGFETFQLKLDSAAAMSLHGKSAKVKFSMNNGGYVYLDNIFFKSNNLSLGNITEARWDTNPAGQYGNNLLLEKPQYVVSYNEGRKNPNWSSWKVDRTWLNYQTRLNTDFIADPDLPNDFSSYDSNVFNNIKMDRGHLTPSNDRSRNLKDAFSTFLTTNVVPQATDNNQYFVKNLTNPVQFAEGSAWFNLERTVVNRVNTPNENNQYYIIDGAFGNDWTAQKASNIPYILGKTVNGVLNYYEGNTNPNFLQTRGINIPKWTWKVILPVDGNNNPTGAFTYLTPNQAEPDWTNVPAGGVVNPLNLLGISRPNISNALAWRNPNNWQIALSELQNILNNQPDLPKFNFDAANKNLLALGQYTLNNSGNSAALLADLLEGNLISRDGQATIKSRVEDPIDIDGINIMKREVSGSFVPFTFNSGSIKVPFSPTQIASLKNHSIDVGSNDLTIPPITINKVGGIATASHDGILQVASNQDGHLTEFPLTMGEIAVNEFTANSSIISSVGRLRNNLLENSSSEIGTFQINRSNTRTTPTDARQDDTLKVSLPGSVFSQQLFSINLSHDNSSLLTNIYSTAQTLWHTNTPIDLNFAITNLPTGQLAEGTINSYNNNGTPKTATITIDDDANGVGWFLDTTPQDNSEFTGIDNYLQATPNSPASSKYDLLTAILHEMGHTLGIINGYNEFDKHIKNGIFTTDTFTTKLTPDGSHLDSTLYPYDLMNTSLKPGVRKLPSALNLAMIDVINSGVGGWVSGVGINPAHLTAGALLAINNGDFSTTADWNTLGATNIINGTATLTEQSQKLSELTQAFIIPTGAKTLQFTITDNHLIPGDTTKTANDAFEVALLDTNTFNPLAGTSIGLNHTDSLLNIQANGTIHKSDKVTITALGNNSTIVTIDLTAVTPTTQATLYFNLLGFGARTSTITIDDVKLFTDTQPLPITKNDTLSTTQNTPLTFTTTQLTTNDTNVNTIQIINQTTHGTLTQTPDGKLTYQPIPTYVGNDSFTYLGYGSDGQISNPSTGSGQRLATVNLTVNNLPPTIQTVTIPSKINEGQTIQLSALAKDGGSSENLTYTWNLGDGSNPITGNNIAHTYTDNGNYEVTLTVTDLDGGSTNQTTTVKVDNLAPTVNLTAPTTSLNQGESLNLGVTYSDPGISDTHTITWNFGDGTTPITLAGALGFAAQPNLQSHVFTKAGTNNVTVTVTDNDGASTTKTLQIAVANLPPTINTLDIPTNINEGSTVQLTATATDPGNDTLTYNWYINGATTPIVGQTIDYQFTDNGVYPVRLNVIDSNGAIATKSVDVTINNVAPVIISIVQPNQINEGQPVQFTATATDVGINDTLTYMGYLINFNGEESTPKIYIAKSIMVLVGNAHPTGFQI